MKRLTTPEIIRKYGQPGDESQFTVITLPYPMRVAWDKSVKITKLRCHKLVATKLSNIFNQILEVYGYPKIVELGIDLYGGCYNFRKMRGGSDWSRHSWAIAIDLDPERNQLKQDNKTAVFARPEYKPMIDIFYRNGFLSYGIERNMDWMHWEVAS